MKRVGNEVLDAINPARPQARNVIIDVREIVDDREHPLSADGAALVAHNLTKPARGDLDYLRIVGDAYDLTFGPFS